MPPRKKPDPAPEAPEPDKQPETQELDAVVVQKVVVPDGGIRTEIQILGGVQATEVQTLLELGIVRWRSQIGLAD